MHTICLAGQQETRAAGFEEAQALYSAHTKDSVIDQNTMVVCIMYLPNQLSLHAVLYVYNNADLGTGDLCDNIGLVGSYVTASPCHQVYPPLSYQWGIDSKSLEYLSVFFAHIGSPRFFITGCILIKSYKSACVQIYIIHTYIPI